MLWRRQFETTSAAVSVGNAAGGVFEQDTPTTDGIDRYDSRSGEPVESPGGEYAAVMDAGSEGLLVYGGGAYQLLDADVLRS